MKEARFFYAPNATQTDRLPDEEANHALRVLRLSEGDDLLLMDGKGTFYEAEITSTAGKHCQYRITATHQQKKDWQGRLHLAVAPTKMMERMEWLAEKATEIGFDALTFLDCRFSERRVVKSERIDKILVSAMKQSHKSTKPELFDMTDFKRFVTAEHPGQKFIAHCYDEAEITGSSEPQTTMDAAQAESQAEASKPFLMDLLSSTDDAVVMIGPEGDFSVEEVRLALQHGFRSVSLGHSRLRTETAALVAVHLMHICHSK